MMKTFSNILCLLTLTLFFCSPSISFADNEALITLSPKTPSPYSPITATLVSYSFDVNTAMITWSRNGKNLLKGIGQKKLTIQTGGVGTQITLHVNIVTADNAVTEMDITLSPESVDILYETPESYIPLFYEGKSLPGEGAIVKFVAMPNISEGRVIIPSSSLSYSWYVNDEFMSDASGYGRSSGLFNLDFFSAFTRIKVVVRSPKGSTAEKFIDIYPHDVMPLLYLYDDVLGTNHNKLLTRRFETTKDFTLSLEPFYLSSNNSLRDTVNYSWALDGLPVTPLGGTLLSMRPKENSYGSRNLSISVSNSKRRLQRAETKLNLIFDTRK